jgi:hypothetical protein
MNREHEPNLGRGYENRETRRETLQFKLKELEALITDFLTEIHRYEPENNPQLETKLATLRATLVKFEQERESLLRQIQDPDARVEPTDPILMVTRHKVLNDMFNEKYLADPETGRRVSKTYAEINIQDHVIIAKKLFRRCLLHPESGRQLPDTEYEDIVVRDGLVIGRNLWSEYYLKRTGHRVNKDGFEHIERRGLSVIGRDGLGREKIIF